MPREPAPEPLNATHHTGNDVRMVFNGSDGSVRVLGRRDGVYQTDPCAARDPADGGAVRLSVDDVRGATWQLGDG